MSNVQIMDLTVVSRSFPESPTPEIIRDHLLDALETMYAGQVAIILLEGAAGAGKTTLLSQFVRRHPQHAISLFIQDTSQWTSAPETLLRDLSNQVRWILSRSELDPAEPVNEASLRGDLFDLRKRASLRREPYYIVLDGLDEVPEAVRGSILALLPFDATPHFRFLLASAPDQLASVSFGATRVKPYQLPPFSLDETTKYLHDLVNSSDVIRGIYHTCSVPGYLALVRRLWTPDTDGETFLQHLPGTLPGLYQVLWEQAHVIQPSPLARLLALIAYSPRNASLTELGQMLGQDRTAVEQLCHGVNFLIVDPGTEIPRFLSASFRAFAREQLRFLKEETYDMLIANFQHAPETDAALAHLPGILEERRRFPDILAYLSAEHFVRLLEQHQSLAPLQQMATVGIRTAERLERDDDLMRFSLQKAAMLQLGNAVIWRSEVAAYMALDDYPAALALAQGTSLKEDRLHLLSVIVKAKRKQGLTAEPELLEQIHSLYHQLDPTTLGKRASEIAADLLYVDPALAIELVEKAAAVEIEEDARDRTLARLSVDAYAAQADRLQMADTIAQIQGRIEAPLSRQLLAKLSLLTGGYSTAEIKAEVAQIEHIGVQMDLLGDWAVTNQRHPHASEVVEFGLTLAIQAVEYRPSARILRELATPLPSVPDKSVVKRLVGSFDSLKSTLDQVGPTEEVVRLDLLLAEAERAYDPEAACTRLVETYYTIEALSDLETRTICQAWYVAALVKIDPHKVFEPREGLHSLMDQALEQGIKEVLNVSADHYRATKHIIKALARSRPEMALAVAQQLNTELNRDRALREVITSALHVGAPKVDLAFLEQVLSQIVIPAVRDKVLLTILEWLATRATDEWAMVLQQAQPLLQRLPSIENALLRARAHSLAYTVLKQHGAGVYDELANDSFVWMEQAWEAIDIGWEKINCGFKLIETIAPASFEEGRALLQRVEEARKLIKMDAVLPAATYVISLYLVVRAYGGLLPRKMITEEDTRFLARFIALIPSYPEQINLWREVALQHHLNGRTEECKHIVLTYINPLFQLLSPEDGNMQGVATIMAAPALYYAHQQTTFDRIAQLPVYYRDFAYQEIGQFILTKQGSFEPFEHAPGTAYKLTYEEIIDLCELMSRMEYDAFIYRFMEAIADTLVAHQNRDRYPAPQRSAILARLERLTQAKFPNPRFIQHEGYKIAAQAQVCRIRPGNNTQEWVGLIRAAETIPNLADRAYVLAFIASAMPNKEATKRKQVLEQVKMLIGQIPITLDRVERYLAFAERIQGIDRSLCKECLQLAMKSAVGKHGQDPSPSQRQIIDLAYRVDAHFAESLVELVDDDPARARLRQRLGVLKVKKELFTQANRANTVSTLSVEEYAEVAFLVLGALQARRVDTLPPEKIRRMFALAATLPLLESYPILAWLIENVNQRFANTDQARTYLRPLYEAMLVAAELAAKMAAQSLTGLKQGRTRVVEEVSGSRHLIRAGEREQALQFLKHWFETDVHDYLKICDPYFGLEDLEILRLLYTVNPTCKVEILTSKEHQVQTGVSKPWGEAYTNHWFAQISDQDPPHTRIFIVGTAKTGKLPVHDRWWLTNGGGLSMGGSLNGLGRKRDSAIMALTPAEAEECEQIVDQYLRQEKREDGGDKLVYTSSVL